MSTKREELRGQIVRAMQSVKPLHYKWTKHDDEMVNETLNAIDAYLEAVVAEVIGRKPTIGTENTDYDAGQLDKWAEQRQRFAAIKEGKK